MIAKFHVVDSLYIEFAPYINQEKWQMIKVQKENQERISILSIHFA